VNFKFTLPELSCEWAAIDSVDIVGNRRRHDLSNSAIYKCVRQSQLLRADRNVQAEACAPPHRLPIGGRVVALEHAAKSSQPAPPLLGATTDVDHYGGRRVSTELTPDFFPAFVREHDAVLVNFHAPWCPHCRAFAPVWEHAAELVLQKLAEAHSKRTDGGAHPPRIALGSVDCTRRENAPLCKEQHIQAFPTVRVYRGGAATTAFDDDAHAHHESYTGARSAEAIADFVATVAQEVLTRTGQVSGADVAPGTYTLGWQPPGTDHDADGVKDSRVLSRGCVIEGSVRMARVPGELHIVPHGAGHSLHMEHINMTHYINHLSFGTFVPSRAMYGSLSWAQRRTFARLPKDSGGKFAAASVTHPPFVSNEDHMEHEHHCKVRLQLSGTYASAYWLGCELGCLTSIRPTAQIVSTQFKPIDSKSEPIGLYEYTVNSFAHRLVCTLLCGTKPHFPHVPILSAS
jgi:acyl-coenzyme A thioesterase 9